MIDVHAYPIDFARRLIREAGPRFEPWCAHQAFQETLQNQQLSAFGLTLPAGESTRGRGVTLGSQPSSDFAPLKCSVGKSAGLQGQSAKKYSTHSASEAGVSHLCLARA